MEFVHEDKLSLLLKVIKMEKQSSGYANLATHPKTSNLQK